VIQKENTKKKVLIRVKLVICEKLIVKIFYPDRNVVRVAHAGCGFGRLPDYPVSGVSS